MTFPFGKMNQVKEQQEEEQEPRETKARCAAK
jgi:hypothetical protein